MNIKKKLLNLAVISLISINFQGCFKPSTINAGEEAVLIKKPWFFGSGGVEQETIKTGLTWTAWTTEVVSVNLKPFNITEPFNDLITIDNNPVDFEIHLTFQYEAGKTPFLLEKFGLPVIDQGRYTTGGWYGSKVKEPLKNSIREYTKTKTMFEMTTSPASVLELEQLITKEVNNYLNKENMPIRLLTATVGKVNPPADIIKATIQTGIQKQNVMTQNERVKAEQAREVAEKASALADKAYMLAINMSPDQYLKMKEIDNQKLAIERDKNVTIIMGGNAVPMFQLNK